MPKILKGKVRIAPMNLITASSVNLTILNGRRISQTSGNNTSITIASGQHTANSVHQRISPINILMPVLRKTFAILKSAIWIEI
jgi:hypothetical protein